MLDRGGLNETEGTRGSGGARRREGGGERRKRGEVGVGYGAAFVGCLCLQKMARGKKKKENFIFWCLLRVCFENADDLNVPDAGLPAGRPD